GASAPPIERVYFGRLLYGAQLFSRWPRWEPSPSDRRIMPGRQPLGASNMLRVLRALLNRPMLPECGPQTKPEGRAKRSTTWRPRSRRPRNAERKRTLPEAKLQRGSATHTLPRRKRADGADELAKNSRVLPHWKRPPVFLLTPSSES